MLGKLRRADFTMLKELHRSSGGSVHLAKHRTSGQHVVLKERHVSELGRRADMGNEIQMYERLSEHPNVVRYLGSLEREGSVLVMAFEYASGGASKPLLLQSPSR